MARTITQFHNMNPDVPEWTDANHMYSLSNVDPLYYLAEGVQEKQKAPLVASRTFYNLPASFTSPIKYIVNSNTPVTFDVFTSHDDGLVSGTQVTRDGGNNITGANVFNGGYPAGGVGSTGLDNKMIVFADKIVVNTLAGYLTTTTINTFGSGWTSLVFDNVTNPYAYLGRPELAVFLDKVWVSDAYNKSTMSAIRGYQNSGTTIFQVTNLVLNIPDYYTIQKMVNYRNKYLIVAGAYNSFKTSTTTSFQSSRNFLFFFNGLSKGFQESVELPATFIDMIMVGSELKLLLQNKYGQYGVYSLSGTNVKLEHVIQVGTPQIRPLFSFLGLLGINLVNKGVYVMGETSIGLAKYIFDAGIYTGMTAGTVDSILYAFNGTNIYAKNMSGTTPGIGGLVFNDINAISQWIPLDNKLTSIDVVYDTAPQAVGDYIRITMDSWGEDQSDSVLTQVLNDITSTSKDTRIKTTLDVKGLTPTKARLTIQTHSTGAWRPIIRQIQMNESKQ